MKPRSLIVALVLLLVLFFAGVNWPLFSEPSTLNLVLTSIEAPLGLVMLGVIGFLSLLFLFVAGRIEGGALVESSQGRKELEKARRLAESAEQSRFEKLHKQVERGFESLADRLDDVVTQGEQEELSKTIQHDSDEVVEKIEAVEGELKKEIQEAAQKPRER